jgi:1-phosphofructokinase family hexose kinase
VFLCVSLNPAIDKRLRLDRLRQGRVNRAKEVAPAPGGKAAHVAMVLKTLGADPLWLGFAGGSTGAAVIEGLHALSIRVEAIATSSATRMNLEIIEDNGAITEILEPGESVTAEEIKRLRDTYEAALRKSRGDATVILSGSLPPGVPEEFYAELVGIGHQFGRRVLVDTSAEPLKLALEAQPDFVKPNQEEAEWLSGATIDGSRSAERVLQTILHAGAKAGAISLGAKGLVWRSANQEKALFANAPAVAVRSSVGSGDATLAGFAFAASQELEPAEALRLAAACGAANCLAEAPGRACADDIARLKKEIHVEIL